MSPAPPRDFYPPIEPYDRGFLPVGGHHRLYYEQCGHPQGRPVLFLHGGPGAGANPLHRRFFDPAHYRIVIFDQRGAGRSLPAADLTDNDTAHLIADIESLRLHLAIADWILFGGSWGATLALAYAIHHRARVRALVLRGIFLGRRSEVDWFLAGIAAFMPEAHRAFLEYLPAEERAQPLRHYYRRLIDPDPACHLPAARAWCLFEARCSTLLPDPDLIATLAGDRSALGLARIEAHYCLNNFFLPENFLLAHSDHFRDLPGIILQGRYDLVSPIRSADDLARAWPKAHYRIVADAGHAATEPGLRAHLLAAMEELKSLPK